MGGGQSSQTNANVKVPKDAMPLAGDLLATGEGVAPNAGDLAFKAFKGPFTLGLRPEEEALRKQSIGSLLADRPGEDASRSYLMSSVKGDLLDPSTNPALQRQVNALSDDSNFNFGRNVNSVRDVYGRTGGGGGSREALALGQAAGENNRGFQSNVSDMLARNYNTERGYQNSNVGALNTLENQPFERQQQAEQLESIPRSIEQSNLTGDISEFKRGQEERFAPLNAAMAILGQRLGSTTQVKSGGGMFK